jgi:hypothetical protein
MKEVEYSHQDLVQLVRESLEYESFSTKQGAIKYAEMKEKKGYRTSIMQVKSLWFVFSRK